MKTQKTITKDNQGNVKKTTTIETTESDKSNYGNARVRLNIIKGLKHYDGAKKHMASETKDPAKRRQGWFEWGFFLMELKEAFPATIDYSKELEKAIPNSTRKEFKQSNANSIWMAKEKETVDKYFKSTKSKLVHPTTIRQAIREWTREQAALEAEKQAIKELMDEKGLTLKEAKKELEAEKEKAKELEKKKKKEKRQGKDDDKTQINGIPLDQLDKGTKVILMTEIINSLIPDVNKGKMRQEEIAEIKRVLNNFMSQLPEIADTETNKKKAA